MTKHERQVVGDGWGGMFAANDTALPAQQARRLQAAWDDARDLLTEAGLPATFETVCALVAAGDGMAARHARGWITREMARGVR